MALALVGAEIARIEGRDREAMNLYEQAIRSLRVAIVLHAAGQGKRCSPFVHLGQALAAHRPSTCRMFNKNDLVLLERRDYYRLRLQLNGGSQC
jgi:hypothetical protein